MTRSSVPPFTILGATYHCYIVKTGTGYEWRTQDGLRVVGRNPGSSTCWARVGHRTSQREFPGLRAAMAAAAREALDIAA